MPKTVFYKYEYAKDILDTELHIRLKEFERKNGYLPVEHIKSRIKSESSIIGKLEKKNLDLTSENIFNNIDDVIGFRIVVSFISDVYDIVNEITNSKILHIKEKRDYIEKPKETGYSSYHLKVYVPINIDGKEELVPAEIQIRTVAMDFWASLDHKIRYKFKEEIPEDVQKEMYDYSHDIRKLDRRMYELNKIMNKYDKNV